MKKQEKEEILVLLLDALDALEQVRSGKDILDLAISSIRTKVKELST